MAFQNFSYPETDEKSITTTHQNEAYLMIDSVDRFSLVPRSIGYYDITSFKDPSNYLINHQKINGLGQLSRIAITDYQFPWVTPNVNVRNNIFFFTGWTGTAFQLYYVIIPEGWYIPSDLATTLQTALNTVQYTNYPNNTPVSPVYGVGTWSVTLDAKTNSFSISNSAVFWVPSPPINTPAINTLMNFPTINTAGFLDVSQLFRTVIGGVPSMAYTTYVDVVSNTLTKFQDTKDTLTQFNYTDIMTRIYLNDELNQPNTYFGTRPTTIYRQISNPKWVKWNRDESIGQIDIQYYDDKGQLLYIPNDVTFGSQSITVPSIIGENQIFTLKMSES